MGGGCYYHKDTSRGEGERIIKAKKLEILLPLQMRLK